MRDASPQVATEADQLERALAAAGLDPDDAMSYPVWNIFTNKGLRAALAAIEQRSTTMQQSFKGIESAEYERARARFNAALTPAAREQIAAAENLVRVAKATTTTRNAGQRTAAEIQRSTAEIIASSERRMAEMQALIARLDAQQARRQAAESRRAVEQTALAELDQKAAKLAKEQQISQVDAYSRVLAAEPELYDRYEAERIAGKYVPEPKQAPVRTMGPVESKVVRLAAEYIKRDGLTFEQACVRVFSDAERNPGLYEAYTKETTV